MSGRVARFGILCLLTALVVLFGRPYVERASEQAWNEPLKAGAIGVLAQILFLPVLIITCVVLVVTIIGIPLLFLIPFIILGLALVGLVGFTGVAYRLGGVLGVAIRVGDGQSVHDDDYRHCAGAVAAAAGAARSTLAGS